MFPVLDNILKVFHLSLPPFQISNKTNTHTHQKQVPLRLQLRLLSYRPRFDVYQHRVLDHDRCYACLGQLDDLAYGTRNQVLHRTLQIQLPEVWNLR